ncbi:MAG: N-acetylneuraminate synthase family protein [Treponema sp.]|nr:N-acetylneuraminate synthase family protein [Treponema sp.]
MKKNENLLKIEGKLYTPQNPLIIAELGTSHNGELSKAKSLVNVAQDSGADCIKVQMVYADEILHPNTGIVPLPGGNIRLYDQFKKLEKEPDFYIEVKKYAESKGILFLCTPFGLKSASILREMQPKMVKIASPELNFTSLLEEIADWGVPALLSSGVSTLADIERAVEVFKNKKTNSTTNQHEPSVGRRTEIRERSTSSCGLWLKNVCLLHCVTAYPAPETDYNLRVLPNLASVFGVSVGVSDHSSDPQLVPALSAAMGACVIEKHFCLSRNDPGLDDPIALEPQAFSIMVNAVRRAAEEGSEETINRYSREKGSELIEQILGSGVKELAPSEKDNYNRTNRSIHTLRDIQKGEVLKKEDFAVLRTEKVLRPGLEPYWENALIGRTVQDFIPAGEGIRFEDVKNLEINTPQL